MTDKMSKEEAKKEFDRWFNPDDLPNRYLVVYEVSKLIDAIEPDHEKVVLPNVVGKWVDQCKCIGKPSALFAGGSMPIDVYNWLFAKDIHTNTVREELLMKAYFNGWTPEREKRYRVKVYGIDLPALFYRKRDDGTQSFVQGGAGLPETEFTMDEIKQRHLENCEREEVTDDDAKK